MKTIILISLLVASLGTVAGANTVVATASTANESRSRLLVFEREQTQAFVELEAAREQVASTRARWDAAIADGHPTEAGMWARRHLEAMHVRKAALLRWHAAAARVDETRFATR